MVETELPYPSLLIADKELKVGQGSSIVVTLISGKKISGTLLEFSPDLPTISIEDSEGETLMIQLDLIKILTFPTERYRTEWHTLLEDMEGVEMPPAFQPFRISFNDGTELSGDTMGYRPDNHGLHLFPIIDKNHFFQTFYSHQAIESYQVGDFLGELLIKDGVITEKEVEAAVAIQSSNRQQQLGEYLTSHAIVTSEELGKALLRQRSMPNMRLGEILVSENLVTNEQIDSALEEQKKHRNQPLGEILITQGVVSQSDIQRSLAKKLGIPFVNLATYQIPPNIIAKISEELAVQHNVIPVSIFEGRLVVAMKNPMDREAVEVLRFHSSMAVEPVMADAEGLNYAIQFYYSESSSEFEGLDELELDEIEEEEAAPAKEDANQHEQQLSENLVVKMANKIIVEAYQQGASDIHIEPNPGRGKTIVRFRRDGTLVEYVKLPSHYKTALVSRIKVMAKLDISERRRPQDGKIDFKKFGPLKIELRVATVPTASGLEDVVLRLLSAGKPISLDKLGLSPENFRKITKLISLPYGMVFVCGPTGSGKTTTLHSILGYINTPERKIWTAEDPVEITQDGLRQVHINPKGGVTFAGAMRAFLRADPDVIMVGEMRDKETSSIGIEASLTGHLVFSTLHTNSAAESIIRLLDMGMDSFNFSDALLGVLAQRLAKRLCSECKEAYQPLNDELDILLKEYCQDMDDVIEHPVEEAILAEWRDRFADKNGEFTLYRAKGCPHCHDTGYRGRVGLHELLVNSDEIKRAIISKMPIVDLNRLAMKEGMRTLLQDGIEKVLQGHTDIKRVRAVCIK